jgi:hypothetical protein
VSTHLRTEMGGLRAVLTFHRLGLTDFMRGKMVERLMQLEKQIEQSSRIG